MEFESFHNGTLLHIGIQEGESAPVDSLLAIIGKEGEDISSLLSSANAEQKEEKSSEPIQNIVSDNPKAKSIFDKF